MSGAWHGGLRSRISWRTMGLGTVAACCISLGSPLAWAAIVIPQGAGAPVSADVPPAANTGQGSIRLPAPNRSEASLQVLRRQAQEGDVRAQVELGLYYYRNSGLPQAGAQARQWWTLAANQGDARAMAGLGYMLGTGTGGLRDVNAGRQWLQKAAAANLAKAPYLLSLVEKRTTGPKALQQTKLLLEQAARDGDAMAMNDVGVERELDGRSSEAREYYGLAAARGNPEARLNLERINNYQRANDEENMARLRARADDGNADALLEIAYRYHLGRGVQRNFASAIQYYRRAADAGSPKAREFLALIFSRMNEKHPTLDEAWMQELAARVNAVALKEQVRNPAQLPDRPKRVEDPLADLMRQSFTQMVVMPAEAAPEADASHAVPPASVINEGKPDEAAPAAPLVEPRPATSPELAM